MVSPNVIPGAITESNQDSTAYVAATGAKGSSGTVMAVGMCAVHYVNGNPLNPIIPFGTNLTFTQPINTTTAETTSSSIQTWQVQDTGSGYNYTQYWVDFYWGENNRVYTVNATDYGIQKVSYAYYQ